MLNSKVKISIMSALFSLLFLFPMVNFDLCCSASLSDDDNPETPQQEFKINDDETSPHVKFNITNENDTQATTTQTEIYEEEESEASDPPTEMMVKKIQTMKRKRTIIVQTNLIMETFAHSFATFFN